MIVFCNPPMRIKIKPASCKKKDNNIENVEKGSLIIVGC